MGRATFGALAVLALTAAGCGRGELASPLDNPATVSDVSERVRASEQRSSEQVRSLDSKFRELDEQLKTLRQTQTAFEEATLRDLKAIKDRLDQLGRKFDQLPVETKLQMNIPFDIKGTFEESVATLAKFTGVPIRIESRDLAEARIPKIRYVELAAGNRAAQLLQQAVSEANVSRTASLADPQQVLVYVLRGSKPRQGVVVTTRRRAAERGELPAIFGKTGQ